MKCATDKLALIITRHQNYLRATSRRHTRPTLDADDLYQESLIALWENMERPCSREEHKGLLYQDLPAKDLDPLLTRAVKNRMLSLIRKEEAGRRDYRCTVPVDDAPEIRDDMKDPESEIMHLEDVARQQKMVDSMIELAMQILDPDARIVAYELMHPRQADPGCDPRSTYSLAKILDCTRDRARRLILEVRAAFAWAADELGYDRDLACLVRA